MRVWINGKLVPARRATVSAFDRGFLYGDGVYETLRAYAGIPFHLMEHYARLRHSCAGLGIRCPFSLEGFRRALISTLRANRLKDAVLRLTVSRGAGPVRLNPAGFHHPTSVILPRPLPSRATRERARAKGVSVAIVGVRRNSREALDPQIKSSNFLNNILALREALRAGADEALMLNHAGQLTEATTANVFIVRRGVLLTPALEAGLLEGVTRGLVLSLARRARVPVRESALLPRDLLAADEAFLTNTTQEITPLVRVRWADRGWRRIGAGRPGSMTTRLQKLFQQEAAQYIAGERARAASPATARR